VRQWSATPVSTGSNPVCAFQRVSIYKVLKLFFIFYNFMIPGSKGLNPHELAQMWVNVLETRQNMSLKVGCKPHF
ncbi:MAG: hypothetical protein PUI41_03890, partial [Lachnospiraceae bacterium]|nr:hypothetical protein [Lachnospiraceae bacterium]